MFTHLNIHSIYSKMRSTLRLEEIITLNESQHVALTDVNTVRGFINFVQASQSKNVRPIAGVNLITNIDEVVICLLYTSPSPRDVEESRMPSSA